MRRRAEAGGLLCEEITEGRRTQWSWRPTDLLVANDTPSSAVLSLGATGCFAISSDPSAELPEALLRALRARFACQSSGLSSRQERRVLLELESLLDSLLASQAQANDRSAQQTTDAGRRGALIAWQGARGGQRPAQLTGTDKQRREALVAWQTALARMWRRFTSPCMLAGDTAAGAPSASAGRGKSGAYGPIESTASSARPSACGPFDAWVGTHLPAASRTTQLQVRGGRGRGLVACVPLYRGDVALAIPSDLLLHAEAADGTPLGHALSALQVCTAPLHHLHDLRPLRTRPSGPCRPSRHGFDDYLDPSTTLQTLQARLRRSRPHASTGVHRSRRVCTTTSASCCSRWPCAVAPPRAPRRCTRRGAEGRRATLPRLDVGSVGSSTWACWRETRASVMPSSGQPLSATRSGGRPSLPRCTRRRRGSTRCIGASARRWARRAPLWPL